MPPMSAAPILVFAAVSIFDGAGHLSSEAFEFVVPGVTRKEVDARLGKPSLSGKAEIPKGRIAPFEPSIILSDLPFGTRPRGPYETETVTSYEYSSDVRPSERATITFRADTVWYAELPPRASERTRAEIERRYGPGVEVTTVQKGTRHLPDWVTVYKWRSRGVAFLEGHAGVGTPRAIRHRVVFPPEGN
jgi:hypothetical protein